MLQVRCANKSHDDYIYIEEHLLLSEALGKMSRMAEYINEMQRVYEQHGDLFVRVQKELDEKNEVNFFPVLYCNASYNADAERTDVDSGIERIDHVWRGTLA